MTIRRKISLFVLVLLLATGSFFYVFDRIYLESGKATEKKTVLIEKGENALVVGEKLSKSGVIGSKYFLVFYLWQNKQLHSLVAGVYEFAPGLKIPEVAKIITGGEVAVTRIPITFPEGWTAVDMAKRLDANGFAGDEFLAIVNNPSDELKNKFEFLGEIKKGQTLEGYLFPDTYYFAKDASAQDIVLKMLANFDLKFTKNMRDDVAGQKKSLQDIVVMASIIEKEAKFPEDLKLVSSVFWNRLAIGQKLQSDATLEYVLTDNKIQHSLTDLQNSSPYNTYKFEGLPPGPVSNPGLNAIVAAINPAKTDYFFFLTDLKTHKTIFSQTFEQHVANKTKYGL
jgi:UPF0755 protein